MHIVREYIVFEKFSEDSDPIQDLNIGMKQKVEDAILDLLSEKGKAWAVRLTSTKSLAEKIIINKKKKIFIIKIVSFLWDFKRVKIKFDEELQNSILGQCLIYPKKLNVNTFWSRLTPSVYYKAKIKPEYQDLFLTLKSEYKRNDE